MHWIVQFLWLIPAVPLLAAAVSSLAPQHQKRLAATMAIGAMGVSFLLSLVAFVHVLSRVGRGDEARQFFNFAWFQVGSSWVKLGWVLDPLTAVMLLMVTFVGLLIFIYSLGYMAQDENFTRFFCFLSLFAAAMLGVVIANSLLLLFICWELVGLTSYLLIGFWYHKPSAAAAAKKAFVTTRIGDLAFLLGMVWLQSGTGTLLFYDNGEGCLEVSQLARLVTQVTAFGFTACTCIALLLLCGAIGKSGQVPLHVWLPDAMEGPTPVSALIHAATMVAAGVFLLARAFPLLAVHPDWLATSTALRAVTWVGAVTAVFAASIALAQTDIKRILAYSTVSQLGFMMLGLGAGGVAVGMFHLITHAFFKALLFLGAGSVIHGCHEEQDIRSLGGLRRAMPVTFATYAAGMLALSGFPLLFSGFWSKDAVLHAALARPGSRLPFFLGLVGALLTAFYMTRQVILVFFGQSRLKGTKGQTHEAHESPSVMTAPLVLLASGAVLLGFVGTPAWPWFQRFLEGGSASLHPGALLERHFLLLLLTSTAVVFAGLGLGWWFYGRKPVVASGEMDPLEKLRPDMFFLLKHKYFVDEIYEWSLVRLNRGWALACDWADRTLWSGIVLLLSWLVLGVSWAGRFVDEFVVNLGFDKVCDGLSLSGGQLSKFQNGRARHYLRILALGIIVISAVLVWGWRSQ
jgi:NADH-quinone oxidoreductase subunit L